jgi:hypothetical protein
MKKESEKTQNKQNMYIIKGKKCHSFFLPELASNCDLPQSPE